MKPYGWWMELEQKQKLTAALAGAVRELAAAGVPSPAVDARALAAHVLGKHLALAPSEFSPQQYANFSSLVSQRAQRIPLQHLIGKMWFRYLELKSVPGVFIVRPETELVAGEAISEIQRLQLIGEKDPLTIDLCTGSGAIALAVATETKNRNVHAVELAENAFMLAETNNIAYGSPVTFRIGDALTEFSEFIGKAAVVVSNPPYVPLTHELSPEVLADPEEALFGGGADGLDFPRKLIFRAARLLRESGMLIMEHADEQGAAVCEIARAAGFANAQTKLDLAGKPRYLIARKA